MSELVIISVVSNLAGILISVAVLVQVFRNSAKQQQTHDLVNSRMAELLSLAVRLARHEALDANALAGGTTAGRATTPPAAPPVP